MDGGSFCAKDNCRSAYWCNLGESQPFFYHCPLLHKVQRESIDMVKRAHQEGRRLHIPRVLLSTSVEFQAANSQQPPREPALIQISAEDPRIKQNPWYQDGL